MPACVTMMISSMVRLPPASAAFRSPLSNDANGSFVFHSGCCGASVFTRSSAKKIWKIHWLLTPKRAVIVEGGDAFVRRNEIRRAFLRYFLDECDDGLLRPRLVPPRKWVLGLNLG